MRLINFLKGLFKKKEKELTWMDIPYRTFLKIKDSEDGEFKLYDIMAAVYGEDVLSLPIDQINKKAQLLKHLTEEIPHDLHVNKVTVNGRKYYFSGLLGKITAAQYIDFMKFREAKDDAKTYAVFFIPEGHKYNDEKYDMEQVFEDIYDIPIPILRSASFFFYRQLIKYTEILQRSLIQMMKKKKLPKEMRKAVEQILESYNNLEYYRTYSDFAK